ncbi:MAG: DUF1232 domain-containing protein [Kofleriaceae bacterium]|nr:DUF1232 domain-containing protein [Kofleriaceae bacterium]MBP6839456.1 DUF1232 domain-containing protein [Kofleriaceae bacterium]MBP9204055.1 DUF1232 domain-containing protein [Kofleriaceae bacterium]
MTSNVEPKFVDTVRGWLVSLPHDLKVVFEALDDENLARPLRELAVGAIMYVVSPNDLIADRQVGVVGYADDAVLLRLALREIVAKNDEDSQAFRDRFPEVFDGLEDGLKLCGQVMGDLMTWLEGKLPTLAKLEYKGKKVKAYLDNDEARELLFEDALVFRTDYPVDEKTIGDKLKKASTVTDAMRRRRADEVRAG